MPDKVLEKLAERRAYGDRVLVVDDDRGDSLLVQEALKALGVARGMIHAVEDGDQAVGIARDAGNSAGAAPVQLILLDLNLAGHRHGLQIPKTLKSDAELLGIEDADPPRT